MIRSEVPVADRNRALPGVAVLPHDIEQPQVLLDRHLDLGHPTRLVRRRLPVPGHPGQRHQPRPMGNAQPRRGDFRPVDAQQEVVAQPFDAGYFETHLVNPKLQIPSSNHSQLPNPKRMPKSQLPTPHGHLDSEHPWDLAVGSGWDLELGIWDLTYLLNTAGSIRRSTRNRLAMARNGNSPTPRNTGPQPYLSTMMPV